MKETISIVQYMLYHFMNLEVKHTIIFKVHMQSKLTLFTLLVNITNPVYDSSLVKIFLSKIL